MIYEGNSKLSVNVDVRMIDFSHAIEVDESAGKDENYIFGLEELIKMFQSIHSKLYVYRKT